MSRPAAAVPRYIVRRAVTLIPVLIGVTFGVFLMLAWSPVDPVLLLLSDEQSSGASSAAASANASAQEYDAIRVRLGLDRPWWVQYGVFVARVARGDLGTSFTSKRPVDELIRRNIGPTFELAVAGLGVAILGGVPLGIAAAVRRGSWLDATVTAVASLGISMPSFWVALLLIYMFAFKWTIIPVINPTGWIGLILPGVALGLQGAALIARLTRSAMIDVLGLEYIRTAWAKGLGRRAVLISHALRNALFPVVTVVGLQFGRLLAGAVIVENVFGRPGLGSLLVGAVNGKDFPVAQGTVLVIALSYVVVNFLVDVTYGIVDPRVRLG